MEFSEITLDKKKFIFIKNVYFNVFSFVELITKLIFNCVSLGFILICAYFWVVYINDISITNAFLFTSIYYFFLINYYFKNKIIGILSFLISYLYLKSIIYPQLAVSFSIGSFNLTSFILNLICIDISDYFLCSSSNNTGNNFPGYNQGSYNSSGQGGGPGGGPGGNNDPHFFYPQQGSSTGSKPSGEDNTAGAKQVGQTTPSNLPSSPSASSTSSVYTDDSTSFAPIGTHHNFNLRGNEIEEVCIEILKKRSHYFSKDVTITDLSTNAGEKYTNYILDWSSIYLKRNPSGPLKEFASSMMGHNRGELVVYSANTHGIGRLVIDSMISTKHISHPGFKCNTYNELAEYFSYKLENKTPGRYTINQLLHEGTEADNSAWNKFKEFVLSYPESSKVFRRLGSTKDFGDYIINSTEKGKPLRSNILAALINQ